MMRDLLPEDCKKCGKNCEGGCTINVRDGVQEALEASKQGVQGLCLRCVAEGGKKGPKADGALVDPELGGGLEELEEGGECGHEDGA